MIRTLISFAAFALMLMVTACGDDASNSEPDTSGLEEASVSDTSSDERADAGAIEGFVRNTGAAVTAQTFQVTANSDICGTAVRSNLLELTGEGTVAGAVVYVPSEKAHVAPAQTMDQIGCQYTPRVIATTPGSVIRFVNSDPTAHNVRVQDIDGGRILLNVAQASKGASNDWTVAEAGTYIVGCDYHPWMNAYVVAVPSNLHAVTDSTGRYRIEGIPAGQRALRFWHNGITVKEKRDVDGRMIGYRFADPIVLPELPVTIERGRTLTYDIPVDLMRLSTPSAQ